MVQIVFRIIFGTQNLKTRRRVTLPYKYIMYCYNIITSVVFSNTAVRLRENRFVTLYITLNTIM